MIQREIADRLAAGLLGGYGEGDTVAVDVAGDEIVVAPVADEPAGLTKVGPPRPCTLRGWIGQNDPLSAHAAW